MSKTMKHWYLRGLGYLAKAELSENGQYISPKIYNHAGKKWTVDKGNLLLKCLNGNMKDIIAEPVVDNHEIHTLEQIDGIALRFAEDAHEGQLDEDGIPVIEHPKAVAAKLNTPIEKAIAYLHDVVEDTDVTLNMIRAAFGDDVAKRVELLTYDETCDYVDEYLWFIADDPIATNVKLADLEHNLERDYAHPEKDNKERIRKHEGGMVFLIGYRDMPL